VLSGKRTCWSLPQPTSGTPRAGVVYDLWPQLLAGCPPADTVPTLDLGALLRGLRWSHAPRLVQAGEPAPKRPEVPKRPTRARSGLRIRVPGPDETITTSTRPE
jgi:hypothetical protein